MTRDGHNFKRNSQNISPKLSANNVSLLLILREMNENKNIYVLTKNHSKLEAVEDTEERLKAFNLSWKKGV